jgi:rhodanese-related sulfurtransferase
MKNVLLIFGVFTLMTLSSCEGQNTSAETQTENSKTQGKGVISRDVDVAEFEKQMAGAGILLDVRTDQEFAEGHMKGAVQIDYSKPDFKNKIAELDKETPVYVYCRSGARSGGAAKIMKDMGFKEVYNLEGGILAWQRAGKPVAQ